MTRKRFIKLFMADGWRRNDANLYADALHAVKDLGVGLTSYKKYYDYLMGKCD